MERVNFVQVGYAYSLTASRSTKYVCRRSWYRSRAIALTLGKATTPSYSIISEFVDMLQYLWKNRLYSQEWARSICPTYRHPVYIGKIRIWHDTLIIQYSFDIGSPHGTQTVRRIASCSVYTRRISIFCLVTYLLRTSQFQGFISQPILACHDR